MSDQIVIVASVACWGTVLIVWLAGALYNARHAPEGADPPGVEAGHAGRRHVPGVLHRPALRPRRRAEPGRGRGVGAVPRPRRAHRVDCVRPVGAALAGDVVEHRTRGRWRSPAPDPGAVCGDAASDLHGLAGDDRRHRAARRARPGDPGSRGWPDRVPRSRSTRRSSSSWRPSPTSTRPTAGECRNSFPAWACCTVDGCTRERVGHQRQGRIPAPLSSGSGLDEELARCPFVRRSSLRRHPASAWAGSATDAAGSIDAGSRMPCAPMPRADVVVPGTRPRRRRWG